MPVNLDAIPDKAPDVPRPVTVRWVIAGIITVLAGAGLTFWFWQGERAGFSFWFTAVCLPLLGWGSFFALRRIGYKLERVATHSFNKEREQVIASEIARGQRFSYLLDEYLINAVETGRADGKDTHLAVMDKSVMMTHCLTRDGKSSVRHSALPDQGTPQAILAYYKNDICGYVTSMVASLPVNMPCYIAFDLCEDLAESVDSLYSSINLPLRRIRHLSGSAILDYWLDRHYENPAALLIISAQIYEYPPEDSGEAIAMMLLSNRQINGSSGIRIHRPQIDKKGTLGHALNRAMLWARQDVSAPLRGWVTGGKLFSEEGLSKASEAFAPKMTAQRRINIDAVTGYAGVAAPWQALILAARQCQSDSEPQIVAVETSTSCHQLCAVTSENTSGIV